MAGNANNPPPNQPTAQGQQPKPVDPKATAEPRSIRLSQNGAKLTTARPKPKG